MKRITGAVLAFLIALSLAGCDKTSSVPAFAAASGRKVTATSKTASEPAAPIFDVGDVDMETTPKSTCFEEVGYDPDFEILVVRFRDSGAVYTYSDFPESAWEDFMAADSLGSFYNAHIKGAYEYEKIS